MSGRLTLGEFVAFSRYLVLLSWPLIAFGWVINIVQRGVASWERMLEVLRRAAEPVAGRRRRTREADRVDRQASRSRHLTFRYPNARGERARGRVVRRSSPGRPSRSSGPPARASPRSSTCCRGCTSRRAGTVFVDGARRARRCRWPNLRRAMGVVPQEPFLFSDTVGGNIAFGARRGLARGRPLRGQRTRPRRAGLARGHRRASATAYDTVVGERGITLSGGQKQRVAIARALAVDPRILVLDDALSAVDTATEEAILRELRGVRQSRTCLIVAHRVSTVRDADQILVLDRRAASSSAARTTSWSRRGGVYADMHRRQLLEEELKPCQVDGPDMHDDVIGKAYDARLMRRLLAYLRPHVAAVAVAFLAILGGVARRPRAAVADAAGDRPRHRDRRRRRASAPGHALPRRCSASGFSVDYVQTYILQSIGQRIMHTLRMQVYGHLQRLDLTFYDRNPVGRLMTRVTTDVDALNDLFASGVITVFGDILVLAGIMIAMLADELAAGARRVRRAAADRVVTALVPQARARVVPPGARPGRAAQRVSAGAHHRHVARCSSSARRRGRSDVRRDQPRPPRRQHRVDLLLRGVLSGDRNPRRALGRAHHLDRRRLGARRHRQRRRARRVPAVLAAVLPADQRPVREVQHPAGGDGGVRADLHAARHARSSRQPPTVRDAAPGGGARPHRVRSRVVRLRGGPLRPARRVVRRSSPASASASSARPGRARPRSSACCCGSTT